MYIRGYATAVYSKLTI